VGRSGVGAYRKGGDVTLNLESRLDRNSPVAFCPFAGSDAAAPLRRTTPTRPYAPTVLRSYGPTVLRSYGPTVLRSPEPGKRDLILAYDGKGVIIRERSRFVNVH
jgi:hypothetical protein